jgi:RNA polymerase sigma-70 factor (ECF subfamily)
MSAEATEPFPLLVARAAEGDRSAVAALCQRFTPAVRGFARRRLRSTEASDEFTQDVMLLLVEALRTAAVEQPERLPGFVLGICRNLARDRARQHQRRDALFAKYGADLLPPPAQEPRQVSYEVMHLEDCLSSLSQHARDVVRLTFVEAAEPAEIAGKLALSPSNVRVLRHRSLASLRECMAKRMSWEAA